MYIKKANEVTAVCELWHRVTALFWGWFQHDYIFQILTISVRSLMECLYIKTLPATTNNYLAQITMPRHRGSTP